MAIQTFTSGQVLTAANMNSLQQQAVMTFATTTARSTALPSPTEGMTTWIEDRNEVQVYDGSAWKVVPAVTASGSSTVFAMSTYDGSAQAPFRLAAGYVSATTSAAYQNTYYGLSAAITFPSSRFTQVPIVVANVANGGYGWASAYSVSSTGIGYMWLVADSNGASRTIHWIAIQMLSTSGNG